MIHDTKKARNPGHRMAPEGPRVAFELGVLGGYHNPRWEGDTKGVSAASGNDPSCELGKDNAEARLLREREILRVRDARLAD